MWGRFWSVKGLIVIVMIGVVVFGATRLLNRSSSPSSVPVSNTELHRAWMEDVQKILVTYDQRLKESATDKILFSRTVVEARDAFLALTVAKEDQQMHLDFVLELTAFMNGDKPAMTRFQKTRKAFDALRGTSSNVSSTSP